jgi:hypothetical protein
VVGREANSAVIAENSKHEFRAASPGETSYRIIHGRRIAFGESM